MTSSTINIPTYLQNDEKLSAVYSAMNKIAPLSMADTSWDNVGILVQAGEPKKNLGNFVMICEDLRSSIVDEALQKEVSCIVTYHPIIFKGLKSLTFNDSQQKTLLRLLSANISVYCAHTSLDSSTNGINDWLARVIKCQNEKEICQDTPLHLLSQSIEPLKENYHDHPNAGQGRIVEFEKPISVNDLVSNIKTNLQLKNVILGLPQNFDSKSALISRVAASAGSASSIVTKSSNVQAYVTGEMSHHEALAAVERGIVVILTLHGNSERGFLRQVLVNKLQNTLSQIGNNSLKVIASQFDSEPLEIV